PCRVSLRRPGKECVMSRKDHRDKTDSNSKDGAIGYATGQFGKSHLGDRNEYLWLCMALTSSSATSTTSMRRRSRKIQTIRKIRASAPSLDRVSSNARR